METLFTETQRFKQWWIWLILLVVNGIFIVGVLTQIVGGDTFGTHPMGNTGLLIGTCLSLLFSLLFIVLRLETKVTQEGVFVRFFPFHVKFKFHPWVTMTKCYVREYSPITEYGGWGLRFGLFGKGTAYNVSGNKGLQLEFKIGKKLLIGTGKADELNEVLDKLGSLK